MAGVGKVWIEGLNGELMSHLLSPGSVQFYLTGARKAVKPQLGYALQKCLRENINAFSDFTVKVEGVSFRCHKMILNACSEYFHALFRSQMKECEKNYVDLQGVTKEAFSVIFDAVYKGIDGLTEENIIEVWHATVLLQIGFMINECEHFVRKVMTARNCLEFYIHAKQLDSKKIKGFFVSFVVNNFELCRCEMKFEQLPFIDVYNILQHDYLRADFQDSAVDVILDWIEHTQNSPTPLTQSQVFFDSQSKDYIPDSKPIEDRSQHVVKLLSAVRLCLVSIECLRKLFQQDVIMSSRAARDLIFAVIDYKLSVKLRHDAWPAAAVHRATSDMKHAMVFASGRTVKVYLLNDGSTHKYATLPDSQMTTLVVFDNVLYMNDCNTIQMCLPNILWETVLESNVRSSTATRRNMLLSLESYIYCLNTTNGSLRRFDCTHGCAKNWKVVSSTIRNAESMIKYKENILIFRTLNGTVQILHYCPNSNKPLKVVPDNPISEPLDGIVSFTYDENVFVLQKNGKLWKVITSEDCTVHFKFVNYLWTFSWEIYGCVVYQKQLFVFGSKDCPHDPADFVWPTNLPGIVDKVKVIHVESDTPCLPIVVDSKTFLS